MPRRATVRAVLIVFLVAGGASIGWLVAPAPLYASHAVVYISPTMSSVSPDGVLLYPIPERDVIRQVAILASPEVMERARSSPEWAALGRGASPEDRERFAAQVSTEHERGDEVIEVTFRDEDPAAALVGVGAVMDAFLEVSGAHRLPGMTELLVRVRAEIHTNEKKLRAAAERILELTEDYGGTEGLDLAFESLLERQMKIEDAILECPRASDGAGDLPRRLRTEAAGVQQESKTLGRARAGVAHIVAEREHLSRVTSEQRSQLREFEQARNEAARFKVVSRGALATSPVRDERLLFSAFGALAGGVLLVLSSAFLRR